VRLLLDTHALIWWLAGDEALTRRARDAIAADGAEVFVSAASAWELATKHRTGRLPGLDAVMLDFAGILARQGFVGLPITLRHGELAGGLPGPHHDPFDRMLMAQAMIEDLWLVSNEAPFDAYGVRRLWG
jgi:PIN domain nuclease of toxin-antitoxin system